MHQAIAIIENSFRIEGRGIIIELKHSENGIAKNTELISEKTELAWTLIARLLFDHAVDKQKLFDKESTESVLMKFESYYKKQMSIDEIVERERNNTFQYLLKPVGHNLIPEQGEKLKICCL